MLKRFARYYKPHMKLFTLDMIAAFIVACADLFYPRIAQNIINDYVPNKNLQLLLISSGALLLIYIIKMLLSYFMQYQGTYGRCRYPVGHAKRGFWTAAKTAV